jgi:phage gp36-like protein
MSATQYATSTDLTNLGISARALALAGADTVTAAWVSASSVADGYLSGRYGDQLPLTTWPESLRSAVAKIAAFELSSSAVGFNPEDNSHEIILERYKQGIQWLRDVAAGRVTLPSFSVAPTRSPTPLVVSDDSRGF